MDPFLIAHANVQWTCPMDPMDPSECIQWTQSPNLVWRVNIGLVFSNGSIVSSGSNMSIGSIEHHWTCPLDPLNIVSIEHCVHWTLCLSDPMDPVDTMSNGSNADMSNGVQRIAMQDTIDPLDTMDPLDKNAKLMLTRQTRFGDCINWIHSDGSIGSFGHVH